MADPTTPPCYEARQSRNQLTGMKSEFLTYLDHATKQMQGMGSVESLSSYADLLLVAPLAVSFADRYARINEKVMLEKHFKELCDWFPDNSLSHSDVLNQELMTQLYPQELFWRKKGIEKGLYRKTMMSMINYVYNNDLRVAKREHLLSYLENNACRFPKGVAAGMDLERAVTLSSSIVPENSEVFLEFKILGMLAESSLTYGNIKHKLKGVPDGIIQGVMYDLVAQKRIHANKREGVVVEYVLGFRNLSKTIKPVLRPRGFKTHVDFIVEALEGKGVVFPSEILEYVSQKIPGVNTRSVRTAMWAAVREGRIRRHQAGGYSMISLREES